MARGAEGAAGNAAAFIEKLLLSVRFDADTGCLEHMHDVVAMFSLRPGTWSLKTVDIVLIEDDVLQRNTTR